MFSVHLQILSTSWFLFMRYDFVIVSYGVSILFVFSIRIQMHSAIGDTELSLSEFISNVSSKARRSQQEFPF